MENVPKTQSSYQKEINRLNKFSTDYMQSNNIRKHQLTQLNLFIKKLLEEKRITVDELKPYCPKKKVVKSKIL